MERKAHLARIHIYPVKGLPPVRVDNVAIDAAGALEHDRAWALVDAEGRFANGKNLAAIHTLNDLDVNDRERLVRAASELVGRPLRLEERIPGGLPDDNEAWGPTVVSTATLATVGAWFDGIDLDNARLRFRANLEIEGVDAFWEDRLYPRRFRIGAVDFEGVNPCQRCIVPSRDPLTGAATEGFQKRFMQRREATLPAWAERRFFNHHYRLTVNTRIAPDQAGRRLRVGDGVTVI